MTTSSVHRLAPSLWRSATSRWELRANKASEGPEMPVHRFGCSRLQVARSLGILDEVNRMKVVPGTSPSSRQTNKTARYMEVSPVDTEAPRSVLVFFSFQHGDS